MRIFISHGFSEQSDQKEVLDTIEATLAHHHIESFSFIRAYPPYAVGEESMMMNDAFKEITSSDLLIAECSSKPIGVGVEVGYAYAKSIPIIYIYNLRAEISKTVKGCAKYVIPYDNASELKSKLSELFSNLQQ